MSILLRVNQSREKEALIFIFLIMNSLSLSTPIFLDKQTEER